MNWTRRSVLGGAGILPAVLGSAGILPAVMGSAGILPAVFGILPNTLGTASESA